MRAPELHPLLRAEPSADTRKARALHQLATEVNLIMEVSERLKRCTGLRPCDKWSPDPYEADGHLRAIERGEYKRALQLLTLYGITSP